MFTFRTPDGGEDGPHPVEQIKIWIRDGLLSPHTLAIKEGETTWKKLYSYPEFFAIGPTKPPFASSSEPPSSQSGVPYLAHSAMPSQTGTMPGAFTGAHNSMSPTGTANLPIVQHEDVRIALPADRIMAGLVDVLVWMLSLLPLWFCWVLHRSGLVTKWDSVQLQWVFVFPVATVLTCFVAQAWMLSVRGQSIGKSLLRLRVVPSTSDDEAPGFVTGVMVRWLLMWLLYMLPGAILVDFFFLFRDDRRCLHDHLAGTRVIVLDE
jgi:uncharacterized RDD family membrane protein YckC